MGSVRPCDYLLVYYELKAYWRLRKSIGFWAIFLSFLFAYFLALGYFFHTGEGVSLVTFALTGSCEFVCMALVIYWILGAGPNRVNLNL